MTPDPCEYRGVKVPTTAAEVAEDNEGEDGKGRNIGDPAIVPWFIGCLARKNGEGWESYECEYSGGQSCAMKVPPDQSVEAGITRTIGTKGFRDAYEQYSAQHADIDDVAVELKSKAPLLDIPPNTAAVF